MNRKEEIRKELEELSPLLSKLDKDNPFEVPYGYFDKMQREVLQQVKEPQVSPARPGIWAWLFGNQRSGRLGLGVISLLVVATAGFFYWSAPNVANPLAGSEAGGEASWEQAAAAYLTANIDELDDDLLADLVVDRGTAEDGTPQEGALDEQLMEEILNELDDLEIEDLL
ncbi:MAG: hypothetical protein AAFW73_00335 [Bacteroidota bacterium]